VRILVTNDDGVDAPGLRALALAFEQAGHDLVVVAPADDRSGSSAAIGPLHRPGPIPFTEHQWADLPGARVLSIDAPPATAVYAAGLGAFGAPPELVASGVNPGANTGHLVLHSGTVGAALTAAGIGVSGLAVSVKWSDNPRFDTAAALAVAAVGWLARHDDTPRVLNLNAPDCSLDDVRGVREAALAPYGEVWVASADESAGEVHLEFRAREGELDTNTDWALVRAGYATVTPLLGVERAPDTGAAAAIEAALAADG
jgi:5'-nucleotidase